MKLLAVSFLLKLYACNNIIKLSVPLNTNVKIQATKFKDIDITRLAYVNCLWCQ